MIKKIKTFDPRLFVGLIGLGLLQSNSIPAIISAIDGGDRPPIMMVLMTLAGLSCYLYHAVFVRRDYLYIAGNTIGIVSNTVLLTIILMGI